MLGWRPESKRAIRRPKKTWRKSVEAERWQTGWNDWNTVRVFTKDRVEQKQNGHNYLLNIAYLGCVFGQEVSDHWYNLLTDITSLLQNKAHYVIENFQQVFIYSAINSSFQHAKMFWFKYVVYTDCPAILFSSMN